ncbi:MAG: methyl-accepting chemotaxis protein [Defluviicoccus sp.]|nr:methyl-accepting chemotaxis protein [Defluviicoccus sp.]MDG4609990.1 methyl-accepting chemotaxis protein [Defluviicoccus sp.]
MTTNSSPCEMHQPRTARRGRLAFSLKGKALALCVLIGGAGLAIVGAGLWGVLRMSAGLEESRGLALAIHHQMEANIMHEAIWGDVLRALHKTREGDTTDRAAVEADIGQHTQKLGAALVALKEAGLAADVRSQIDSVAEGLAEYASQARRVGGLAFRDYSAANARLLDLQKAYNALKATQEQLSNALERAVEDNRLQGDGDDSLARTLMLGGLAIMLLLSIANAVIITRAIIRPVTVMTGAMTTLASGETGIDIPGRDRSDEIGAMAQAVQVFKDNAIAKARLEAEQEEGKRRAESQQRQLMDQLAAKFEAEINGIVQAVAAAAAQMQATSETMSVTAGETSRQAAGVASSSQQASGNVQMVAAAAEELSASIREISRQMSQSHTMTQSAAGEAETARGTVNALAEVASRIGAVVTLINDIASQTNLLALNATIEAARAGDAGKGFAVVASEVKALATQTTKATEEIAAQINAVQGEITGTVGAIEGITATIGRINEIAATIAAAVEEQQAATAEIARNVEQAATGTQEVSSTIGTVTTAANETGTAAGEVMQSARQLGDQAEALRALADAFTVDMRLLGLSAPELIKLAKDDHTAFKQKILDVVDGRLKLKADRVPDHHHCRLGRWCDQVSEEIRHLSGYQQMLEPHKRVHDAARQVLVALEQSGVEAARRAITPLTDASEAVLRALDTLEAQVLAVDGSRMKEAA